MTVRSVFAISLFALAAGAADLSAQARSTTRGFHLGAGLNGSSIKADVEDEETGLEADRESGAGISLTAGYNFTPQFGLLITFSGASIDSDEGGSYGLGHGDLAGRFSFANPASPLVPYLELGVTSVALVEEVEDEDVQISGTGITGAVGINYFFSPKLALDANLRFTSGELDTLKIGGESVTTEDGIDVTTGRINIGISWFPGGGR
jgi:opacity protein-like surface antigen